MEFRRVLKDSGSLVIDIGGAWKKGCPSRSLYHFKLLIMLCEDLGLHLAQDFYWWNPSKLPTPAEWVTVRRIRVKDAVNTVWWLSKTPWPKASNRRVLQPYSPAMQDLLAKGYRAKKRPSGHEISESFGVDNGAAIPPNLLAIPNTESNSFYLRYCEQRGLKPHPARSRRSCRSSLSACSPSPATWWSIPSPEAVSPAKSASASDGAGSASSFWKTIARRRSAVSFAIRGMPPGRPGGRLVDRLVVRPDLERVFAYRRDVLRSIFGSADP